MEKPRFWCFSFFFLFWGAVRVGVVTRLAGKTAEPEGSGSFNPNVPHGDLHLQSLPLDPTSTPKTHNGPRMSLR